MLDIQDSVLGWSHTTARITKRVAAVLGCEVNELVVINDREPWGMSRGGAPFPGKITGMLYDDNFIIDPQRTNNRTTHGYSGIVIGKTDHETPCTFARVMTQGYPDVTEYLALYFIKKSEVFKVKRYLLRVSHDKEKEVVYPILEPATIKTFLDNTIGFYKNRQHLKQYKVNLKRGIMISGPPGNGKTMLCRCVSALANNHKIPIHRITSTTLTQAHSNDELNEVVNQKGILFFDDIDISFFDRHHGDGRMACSLLAAMDGIETKCDTIRVFTTNEDLGAIDEAFLRPGRIDIQLRIERPREELRRKLIETWPETILNHPEFSVEKVVDGTPNFSFAELESIRTSFVLEGILNNNWDIEKAITYATENKRHLKPKRLGLG